MITTGFLFYWSVFALLSPISTSERFLRYRRVVGGSLANIGEYPFQAAILTNNQIQCGGTLIDSAFILTAAHCLPPWGPKPTAIYLGTSSIDPPEHNYVKVEPEQFICHEKFTIEKRENDIGIIILKSPVTSIRPVLLPPANSKENYTEQTVSLIGWGKTQRILHLDPSGTESSTSNHLHQVNVTVISNDECSILLEDNVITKTQLCTTTLGQKGFCQGDSGGPLLVNQPAVQIGIISAGAGCADPRYPSVYTRVSEYVDWIYNITTAGKL